MIIRLVFYLKNYLFLEENSSNPSNINKNLAEEY